MTEVQPWCDQLADQRSKKIIFLSHCLLNENTRYLGGACRQGCVQEILQLCLERGIGIVQMPCPEELAWGGVLKRRLLTFFGSEGTLVYRWRNKLLPMLLWYTRRIYRRIAKRVTDQIEDYLTSGFSVVGIVGVDGSPTCGVHQTLAIKRALELLGQLPQTAQADDMNEIVQTCRAAGTGLFIELLRKELARRKLNVPFLAHDLTAELQGAVVPLRL